MTTHPKIVISDSSVLMDLAKVELIEPVLELPFSFLIPDVIHASELLDLGRYNAANLESLGFEIGNLDADNTQHAIGYYRQNRNKLSMNDCFALRLTEVHSGILMSGDGDLRKLAQSMGVEVHGVLWTIELLDSHKKCSCSHLASCLTKLHSDPCSRLPKAAVRALLGKLTRN